MQLHNIDCIEFLKTCENNIFDLIIADPPYFQIYGEFDFQWQNLDHYLNWTKKWIAECHRTLKNTGSFYLWGAIGITKGYPLFKIADWIETNNLFLIQNWITQKNTRGYGNKKGFIQAREELLFMTKSKKYTWNTAYTDEKSNRKDLGANGKPRTNKYKRCTDVWTDIAEASQSSKERFKTTQGSFPTVKAQKLCKRIIQASSNQGDTVYIPFGGSGSEAISCIQMNRLFALTELNHLFYHEIIIPRLKNCLHSTTNEV